MPRAGRRAARSCAAIQSCCRRVARRRAARDAAPPGSSPRAPPLGRNRGRPRPAPPCPDPTATSLTPTPTAATARTRRLQPALRRPLATASAAAGGTWGASARATGRSGSTESWGRQDAGRRAPASSSAAGLDHRDGARGGRTPPRRRPCWASGWQDLSPACASLRPRDWEDSRSGAPSRVVAAG